MRQPTIAEVHEAQRIIAEARAEYRRLGAMDENFNLSQYDKAVEWYRRVDELDMFYGPVRVIEAAKRRAEEQSK